VRQQVLRRGMGEGDSKLVMMIGAFEGWRGAAFALFAGAAQGLLVFAYLRLTGQEIGPEITYTGSESAAEPESEAEPEPESEVLELSEPPPAWLGHHKLPFGPFLALGALEFLFFGEPLIELWFGLVTRVTSFF
jgi:leader peptidase (prepilin peptidase)/N-methyltransferase